MAEYTNAQLALKLAVEAIKENYTQANSYNRDTTKKVAADYLTWLNANTGKQL